MSSEGPIIPFATYNLALKPYDPTPAINEEFPVTIKINLAALDPEAVDDDAEPSTLRLMKKKITIEDYEDEFDSEDEEDELDEEEEEEEEEDKKKEDTSKKSSKKGKKQQKKDEEEEEEESDEALDEEEIDEEVEEYVLCTLSPKFQYQQTLELTITPDEDVYFVVTGSYPIHLSGNYVTHSYYEDDDDYLYDDLSDEDYYENEDEDEGDYDLTPDEDEVIEGRIEEIEEEEEEEEEEEKPKPKKESKKSKKRAAEEEEKPEPKKSKKQQKEEAKKVKFDKELEKGPSDKKTKEAANKVKKQTLSAGVVIEDRTIGEGKKAKNNDRIGVRYIGKLKNGKVFDKNVKGKPFKFNLGQGDVIRGWDIGIAGMAAGGERRIIIPAAAAYGSQSLPGIPANSELTFDVKLLSIK